MYFAVNRYEVTWHTGSAQRESCLARDSMPFGEYTIAVLYTFPSGVRSGMEPNIVWCKRTESL